MILFAYTHWFWITILIVYTSAAAIQKESENATVEQTTSNSSKIELTTSITPLTSPTTGDNITGLSLTTLKEDNITTFNTGATSEEETLTTLETAYREFDNESLSASASDRSAASAISPDDIDVESPLTAAGITGITVGCVVFVGVLCSVSYFWYRGRGFNRPQVLTDRSSNLDSSGYIDDTSVRDNSEEMYSLDNDSFLNSLEAMTIQNYWTDTVKHTKL